MPAARVVVTGGSGFIGTNLVEHFRGRGWETYNLDLRPPQNPTHAAHWTQLDILDRTALIDTIRKLAPDVVLHFAARTDLSERTNLAAYRANIEGVLNLVEAVRGTTAVERLVVASSQLVHPPGLMPHADDDYRPSTLYGESKVLTERIVRAAHDMGATWTIVRPTSLWGPWFGIPFRPMFELIARNRYIHPAGVTAWKHWGYVGNLVVQVERLVNALPERVHRRTLYLADYEPVELHDFVERVRRAFGARPVRLAPPSLLRIAGRLGDAARLVGWRDPPLTTFRYSNIVRNERLDLQETSDVCGPLPYGLDEGIAMTVAWLRARRGAQE